MNKYFKGNKEQRKQLKINQKEKNFLLLKV